MRLVERTDVDLSKEEKDECMNVASNFGSVAETISTLVDIVGSEHDSSKLSLAKDNIKSMVSVEMSAIITAFWNTIMKVMEKLAKTIAEGNRGDAQKVEE